MPDLFDCVLFSVTGILLIYEIYRYATGQTNLFTKMKSWFSRKK